MYRKTRYELKEDLRKAMDVDSIKDVIKIVNIFGISTNKLLVLASVDPSNFYKFIRNGTGVSSGKRLQIYRVVTELFL